MTRTQAFAVSLLVLFFGIIAFVGYTFRDQTPDPGTNSVPEAKLSQRASSHEQILARVRHAAARKLPGVTLAGREEDVFATIDGGIDELDVMEVLLAVETEFDLEVPDAAIVARIGRENRRDLLHHLSLSDIARVVEDLREELRE